MEWSFVINNILPENYYNLEDYQDILSGLTPRYNPSPTA